MPADFLRKILFAGTQAGRDIFGMRRNRVGRYGPFQKLKFQVSEKMPKSPEVLFGSSSRSVIKFTLGL